MWQKQRAKIHHRVYWTGNKKNTHTDTHTVESKFIKNDLKEKVQKNEKFTNCVSSYILVCVNGVQKERIEKLIWLMMVCSGEHIILFFYVFFSFIRLFFSYGLNWCGNFLVASHSHSLSQSVEKYCLPHRFQWMNEWKV